MNTRQLIEEISDSMENNIQPEIILKNLYDKYLKDVAPEKISQQFFYNTRSVTRKITHTAFHSLPSKPVQTKRKATGIVFFNPKRIKRDEKNASSAVLESILDLYYGDSSTTKNLIITILSAYFSFFRNQTCNLPPDIQSELNLTNASNIILNMFDDTLLQRMITTGNASGLDGILTALPDKGIRLIEHALQEMQNNPEDIRDYIRSFGQIPGAIAAMPLRLQTTIATWLVDRLENRESEYRDPIYVTIAALANSILIVPKLRERACKYLHAILRSTNYPDWNEAAYCLSQLAEHKNLQECAENNKTINCYLNYLESPAPYTLRSTLDSLGHLQALVSHCKESLIKKLILRLSNMLNSLKDGHEKTRVLQTLCNLNRSIAALPEDIVELVISSVIKNLPYLKDFNRHVVESPAASISKLYFVLKDRPIQAERILIAIFDELTGRDQQKGNKTMLIELFLQWHHFVIEMEDHGAIFLEKLHQHFNNKSHWLGLTCLSSLLSCLTHLPDQARPLVEFFQSKLTDNDKRTYAIQALGCLNFSLLALPDSGLATITWMEQALRERIACWHSNPDSDTVSALIPALGRMSEVLNVHQQFIRPVMMGLCSVAPGWGVHSSWTPSCVFNSIANLKTHLNNPEMTENDKQKILATFTKKLYFTGASTLTSDLICLINEGMNKKEILDKVIIEFKFRIASPNPEDSRNISNMLIRIALNWPTNHPKQLSWLCVLEKYLKWFSTNPESPNQIDLANALGAFFVDLKRKELVLEHMPEPLVDIVEEYADESYKLRNYDQVQRYTPKLS